MVLFYIACSIDKTSYTKDSLFFFVLYHLTLAGNLRVSDLTWDFFINFYFWWGGGGGGGGGEHHFWTRDFWGFIGSPRDFLES